MDVEPGSRVELRDVLLVSDGDKITVGNPTITDAIVIAEVVEHGRGKKVINFKYKAKTRYRRKRGHRQGYTKLAVKEILVGGTRSAEAETTAPARRRGRAAETPLVEGDDSEIDAEDIVNATMGEPATGATSSEGTTASATRRRSRAVEKPLVEGDDSEIDAEDIVNATMGEPETDAVNSEGKASP
jgi:large subunit ribosomal protein L21